MLGAYTKELGERKRGEREREREEGDRESGGFINCKKRRELAPKYYHLLLQPKLLIGRLYFPLSVYFFIVFFFFFFCLILFSIYNYGLCVIERKSQEKLVE